MMAKIPFGKLIGLLLLALLGVSQVSYSQCSPAVLGDEHVFTNAQVTGLLGSAPIQINPGNILNSSPCYESSLKNSFLDLTFNTGDKHYLPGIPFSASLTVKLTYTMNSGIGPGVSTVTLNIDDNNPEHVHRIDLSPFSDGELISSVTVALINPALPTGFTSVDNSLAFKARFHTEQKTRAVRWGSPATPVVTLNNPVVITGSNRVNFSWNLTTPTPDMIPNYELQVMRVYNTDPNNTTVVDVNAPVNWDQALSIETESPQKSIHLSLMEGTGYYIWRVRPIGNWAPNGLGDADNWGVWSAPSNTAVSFPGDASNNWAFFFVQPDDQLNWIYSRTFSSGSFADNQPVRMGESITFANGLNQITQTQGRIASNNEVAVGEVIRDYSGREAWAGMPIPKSGKTDLTYESGFTESSSGVTYGPQDFDMAGNYTTPGAVYSASGSNYDYFSDNNADNRIPDAEGFPYSRTRFLNDGTGRPVQTSAPGETFKIRPTNNTSDRSTRYFYSGVAEDELLRVFGDEAPLSESVSKVMVLDPNKVMTVTYIDKAGRTIATCLESNGENDYNDPTAALDGLESQVNAAFNVRDDIQQKQPYGQYGNIASKTLSFGTNTTISVNYELDIATIQDICANYCATCDYTVLIQVKDDQQQVVQQQTLDVPPGACNFPIAPVSMGFNVSLAPGTYTISKIVEVNNWNTAENKSNLQVHQDALCAYYEDLVNQAPLSNIIDQLQAGNVDLVGFYDLLGVDITIPNATTAFMDSCAPIIIGCDTFKIPIEVCPTYECDNPAIDEFVDYFTNYWDGEPFIVANGNGTLPFLNGVYTEAAFEQMIKNMVEDGYSCKQLWDCWTGLTDSYTTLTSQNGTGTNGTLFSQGVGNSNSSSSPFASNPLYGGLTYDYDIVEHFLFCTGYQYQGAVANANGTAGGVILGGATPGYTSHAYAYFNYQWGDKPPCENAICPGATNWQDCAGMIASSNDPAAEWLNFQQCVENTVLPVGGSVNGTPVVTYQQAQVDEMIASCENICDLRRASFRQAAIEAYHQAGLYVEGDQYYLTLDTIFNDTVWVPKTSWPLPGGFTFDLSTANLECMLDQLVANCKEGCNGLEIQMDGSVGPAAAMDAWVQSSMWAFELNVADKFCDPGYTTIKPDPAQTNSSGALMAAMWTQWLNNGGGLYGNGQLPPGVSATAGGSYQLIAGNFTILINPYTGVFQVFTTGNGTPSIVSGHPFVSELNNYFADFYNYEFGAVPITQRCQSSAIGDLLDNTSVGVMRNLQDIVLNQDFIYVNNGVEKIGDYFEDRHRNDGIYGETEVFNAFAAPHASSVVSSYPNVINRRVILDYLPNTTWSFGIEPICQYYIPMRDAQQHYRGCFTLPPPFDFGYHSGYDMKDGDFWEFGQDANGYLTYFDPDNVGGPVCTLTDVQFITDDKLVFSTGLGINNNYGSMSDPKGDNPKGEFVFKPDDGFIYFQPPGGAEIKIDFFKFDPAKPCDFKDMCFKWVEPVSQPIDSIYVDTIAYVTCEDEIAASLRAQIEGFVADLKAEAVTNIAQSYQENCADPYGVSDRFWLEYALNYHHYTLYYHDRAGRLIKTVPPEGVDQLDPAATNVKNRQVAPQHRMVTAYNYSSRGELIAQNTPDGGTAEFWYDNLNQLRFSQDAQQKIDGKYSYVIYDDLGRIVESGVSNQSVGYLDNYVNNQTFPSGGQSEQVWTYYDEAVSGISLNGNGQQHLHQRVSWVRTTEGNNTYYSYDPHGNVAWMVQRVNGLGDFTVEYDYDLYTNNVLQVSYQEGLKDQFFHRYHYDMDNRITLVETSTDGVIWDRDAHYEYYAYGPLARTELGEDDLQGLDYIYTLQGWLKAINDPSLSYHDDGQDGLAGTTHEKTARDAFGMALTYYDGDFDRTNHPMGFTNGTAGAKATAANRDLYNGNISSISYKRESAGLPEPYIAYQYRYDEINRLKKADYYENGSSWTALTDRLSASYTYDANGNLEALSRYSNTAGQLMDEFDYRYNLIGNEKVNNRLDYVIDGAAPGVATNDIDNQAVGNYGYDAVGNLTKDNAENIVDINWKADGKVESIRYSGTHSDLAFAYDAMGNRVSKTEKTKDGSGVLLNPEEWPVTYYVRDAQGNLLGTYERRLESALHYFQLTDQPVYGSSRLGSRQPAEDMYAEVPWSTNGAIQSLGPAVTNTRKLGKKSYELSDHLGNVRVVISDRQAPATQDDYALDFDGTTDYVSLDMAYNPGDNLNAVTVEAWINTAYAPTTGSPWYGNWSIVDFDRSDYYMVFVHANGTVGFSTHANGFPVNDFYSNSTVNDGNWHHVVAVYDGTNKYIYIDGVLDAQVTPPHSGAGLSSSNTRYGFMGDGSEATALNGTRNNYYYEGKIDEVRIWHTARSLAEINAYMHLPLTGTEPGLQGYWNMNEGSGQTLTDLSGNGHTGYLGADIAGPDGSDPAWHLRTAGGTSPIADIISLKDYYPFGMEMPGRSYTAGDYRFGFNGMEKDDEVKGSGNSYTTLFRQYDPRLGRWLSVDPKGSLMPWQSSYVSMDNNPMVYTDPLGDIVKYGNFLDRINTTVARVFDKDFRAKFNDWQADEAEYLISRNEKIKVRLVDARPKIEEIWDFEDGSTRVTNYSVDYNVLLFGQDIYKIAEVATIPLRLGLNIGAAAIVIPLWGVTWPVRAVIEKVKKKKDDSYEGISFGFASRVHTVKNDRNILSWGVGNYNEHNLFRSGLGLNNKGKKPYPIYPTETRGLIGFRLGQGMKRAPNFIDIFQEIKFINGPGRHFHLNVARKKVRIEHLNKESFIDLKQ